MDRELRVMQDGYLLAELIYNYDNATRGTVRIIINRIYDLGEDSKSSYPIYDYESYVSHGNVNSVEDLKAYDKDLLKKQPDFAPHLKDALEYVYEPMQYRYVISQGHRGTVGIALIDADFNANTKELKFISARRQKEDINMPGTSLEANKAIMQNICETYLDCYGADMKRVGWN